MDNTICDISAEQHVLSTIMLENSIKDELDLSVVDFYREAHRAIYEAMNFLWFTGKPIDVITLADRLKEMNKLEGVGGLEYLMYLQGVSFTTANVGSHAEILRECAVKRELLRYTEEAKAKVTSGQEGMSNILSELQTRIMELSMVRAKEDEVQALPDVFQKNIEQLKKNATQDYNGLQTDFKDFDKMTGGLRNSDLIVLAARPAMGKTAFALNIAQNVSFHHGKSVLVFSLEMSTEQLANRVLSSISGVEGSKMRRPKEITHNDWKSLQWASEKLSETSLYVCGTPDVTPATVRRVAKQVKYEHGLDLIIIDYLQLMGGDKKSESRTQEVSAISRALKLLARELDVPIVALSQLSRSVEARVVKKPMLSDLRESGAIEQDADLVMFLYRDTYYNPDSEDTHTELIIAKHRHGPVGTVCLYFDEKRTTFRDLSRRPSDG